MTLILTLAALGCSATRPNPVKQIFHDYRGVNTPGAAVMVIRDGRVLLKQVYGLADLERQIPVTSATNFRLASVSKQFTAMSIMILIERGKLDYNTTLNEIFPDFPDYGRRITIQHLLQHTSGLIDYEDLMADTATVQVHDRDVLNMMMSVDSTYFAPGSKFSYSNSGYAVLALTVEKLSGRPYAQFLREEIFLPLGMNNTVAYEKDISTVPNRAFGYTVTADSVRFSDQSSTSAVLGDGGIYTSIDDLFHWDQVLYGDRLVSIKNLERAFTPGLNDYGFGWRIDQYKNHRRVHHTGSTCGFRNVIQRFPDENFTVIILTNRRDPEVEPLAEALADYYLIRAETDPD
ncbi:MAG: serine hydrolase domain-containing protein [Candidatus Neomarinimicrobiota bacterium]